MPDAKRNAPTPLQPDAPKMLRPSGKASRKPKIHTYARDEKTTKVFEKTPSPIKGPSPLR